MDVFVMLAYGIGALFYVEDLKYNCWSSEQFYCESISQKIFYFFQVMFGLFLAFLRCFILIKF